MKIAIIGYGKMGKMIEQAAAERGHTTGLIIDVENIRDLNTQKLKGCDVAIEFTTPDAAFDNISKCFDASIPVVSGTTGWHDRLEEITRRCLLENKAFLYASNFSIGVNILFALNRKLAGIMNKYPSYSPSMTEIHHIHKLDAPSGTAITLAKDIIAELDRLDNWTPGKKEGSRSLPIKSIRADNITGIHEIIFDSEFDVLSLKHTAKNRIGLAAGALLAAEFIVDKKGVFTMEDVLGMNA